MLRRLQIALSVALLATACLEAPFAHVHPGDADHHPAAGFVHSHFDLHLDHHSDLPEMEPHDDDETPISIDWAPTVTPKVSVVLANSIATVPMRPALIVLGVPPELAPRAHSPPGLALLPPRAPPL